MLAKEMECFFSVEHGDERLALLFVSAFIDDRLHRAVALVDRTGPRIQMGEAEAVERDAAKVTALDPTDLEASAIALAGSSLELAGTAVIAVAAAERDRLYAPVDHFHDPQMGAGPTRY